MWTEFGQETLLKLALTLAATLRKPTIAGRKRSRVIGVPRRMVLLPAHTSAPAGRR